MGIRSFVEFHLKHDLKVSLSDANFDEWLASRQVLVSLNKKDLIESCHLKTLEKLVDKQNERFSVNQISSINNDSNRNDINNLLKQLKTKLDKL